MIDLDLLSTVGPVRDQGSRPTCLSFACSDAHGHSRCLPGFLSPESLHQQAAALTMASAEDAISPATAKVVLEQSGQTTESAWPYGSSQCIDQAAIFYPARTSFAVLTVSEILRELNAGRPIVVILDIGVEFYEAGDSLSGDCDYPPEAVHAVIVAGAIIRAGEIFFKLRNSWGPDWGADGYKWASEAYLTKQAKLMMILEGMS